MFEAEEGDIVKVTYESQRNGNEVSRRGEVTGTDERKVVFTDADNKLMRVKIFENGRVVSHSTKPFSGRTTYLGDAIDFEVADSFEELK